MGNSNFHRTIDNVVIIENVDNVAIIGNVDNVDYDDSSFWQIGQSEEYQAIGHKNSKTCVTIITNIVLRDASASKNSLRQYFFPRKNWVINKNFTSEDSSHLSPPGVVFQHM